MTFFFHQPKRGLSCTCTKKTSTKWVNNREPKAAKPKGRRMNPQGKKSVWWVFVNKCLTVFFLKISLRQACEICDGTAYCGQLTPAHSRRRRLISIGDFYWSTRVIAAGDDCHARTDQKGIQESEDIIEAILKARFEKMNLSEERVNEMLHDIAVEILEADRDAKVPRFQQFWQYFTEGE